MVFGYVLISALHNQKLLVSFGDKPSTRMAVPRLIHVSRALSNLPMQIKRASKIEFLLAAIRQVLIDSDLYCQFGRFLSVIPLRNLSIFRSTLLLQPPSMDSDFVCSFNFFKSGLYFLHVASIIHYF